MMLPRDSPQISTCQHLQKEKTGRIQVTFRDLGLEALLFQR